MMDTEEHLASLRAGLNREPPPYPDLREELQDTQTELAHWKHKAMSLSAEVTSRNAANIALNEELRDEREGGGNHCRDSFASTQSADVNGK